MIIIDPKKLPDLRLGARGPAVKAMKITVNQALGKSVVGGRVTGWYWYGYVARVRLWKRSVGLPDDSVIGSDAWEKLVPIMGPAAKKLVAPIASADPPSPPVDLALEKARDMLAWARGFTGSYKLGGGHGIPLVNVQRNWRLDCSSSSSLLLYHFGLFDSAYAHVSGWYETWGESGRGRYVTVHATYDHMWVEFALPEGWWRFDTSPHGEGPPGPRVRTTRRSDSRFVHRHPEGL